MNGLVNARLVFKKTQIQFKTNILELVLSPSMRIKQEPCNARDLKKDQLSHDVL